MAPWWSQEELVVEGERAAIVYARDASGRMRAREFIEEQLADPNQARRVQGMLAVMEGVANRGGWANKEHYKPLKGKGAKGLVEFKRHQLRVIGFWTSDGCLCLTHGFVKKKDRTPREEVERAQAIRRAFLTEIARRKGEQR